MLKIIKICRQIVGTPVVDVRRYLPNATSRAAGDVSLPHTNQRMSGDVGDAHRCDLQHDPLAVTWVCDGHCVGYGETVAGARGGVSVRADLELPKLPSTQVRDFSLAEVYTLELSKYVGS